MPQRLDPAMLAAIFGLIGTVVGAATSVFGQFLQLRFSEKAKSKTDNARTAVLRAMLDTPRWRKLTTLMHVIGADEETTKRLLIEAGARASENGTPVWGLIDRHPLPMQDDVPAPSGSD